MGLFSRKPKISIEEFCREFYDTQIFYRITGTDVGSIYFEAVFNSIVEADQSFAVIDKAVFQREMTALHMELFSLAWMHKFKRAEYAMPQSIFTKIYLKKERKLYIWKIMAAYNQANLVDRTEWELLPIAEAKSVASLVWWAAAAKDPECVFRAKNCIGTHESWKKGMLLATLTDRLAARLGCREDLESEALFRLREVIFGFYNGAKEAIKSVNLQV